MSLSSDLAVICQLAKSKCYVNTAGGWVVHVDALTEIYPLLRAVRNIDRARYDFEPTAAKTFDAFDPSAGHAS